MGLTLARGSTAAAVFITTAGSTGFVKPEESKVVPKETEGGVIPGECSTLTKAGLGRSPPEFDIEDKGGLDCLPEL